MTSEIINKIKIRMEPVLQKNQMKLLEQTIIEIFNEESDTVQIKKDYKGLVKQFINAKKIEGCSKRTEEYYTSVLKFYEKNIPCNVCSATTNIIRDYLNNYQKINNCSNVTLDTIRRILSSFYKWLEEEDYILKSPMNRIHRIKSPITIKPALTEEQVEIIRSCAVSNQRNLAIIDLLLSSGIRVSELVKLNKSSINLNSGTCIVYGKGAKQRIIYFDTRTKIELEKYLNSRKDKNRALFITTHKKTKNGNYSRLTVNSIEKIIRDIGEKAEIENVHPHRFRRTLATKAIDKGMPIEQVQVLLGHVKIDTTLRYANVQQTNIQHSYSKFIC